MQPPAAAKTPQPFRIRADQITWKGPLKMMQPGKDCPMVRYLFDGCGPDLFDYLQVHEMDNYPDQGNISDMAPVSIKFDPALCEAVEIGVGVEEWRVR